MSDDEPTVTPERDEAPTKPRRPQPGASAASRARRIGGRPLPGPGKAAGTTTSAAPVPAARPAGRAASTTTTKTTTKTNTKTTTKTDEKPKTEPADAPPPAVRKPVTRTAGARSRTAPEPTVQTREPKRRDAEATLARLRWVPAVVLGLAAVVLAVCCVVFGHGVWWAKKSVSAERDQVLAAAKTCVGSITNYDYRKLSASEQAGLACTTGTFQSQYKQAMDTVVAKLAPQTKTVQTFQVADAGIESVSSDGSQWVVLVYGQQAVTNAQSGSSTPRLDILSARVTLEKVGGQWRVAELKRL